MTEQQVPSDMIFVFGSNRSGFHGAGAARYAHQHLGAGWGCGEGRTGNCYALPTKGKKIEFLKLEAVDVHVKRFLHHARLNKHVQFKVSRVGCGLGGFTDDQIAPLFKSASNNCWFDEEWKQYLGDNFNYWGRFE